MGEPEEPATPSPCTLREPEEPFASIWEISVNDELVKHAASSVAGLV